MVPKGSMKHANSMYRVRLESIHWYRVQLIFLWISQQLCLPFRYILAHDGNYFDVSVFYGADSNQDDFPSLKFEILLCIKIFQGFRIVKMVHIYIFKSQNMITAILKKTRQPSQFWKFIKCCTKIFIHDCQQIFDELSELTGLSGLNIYDLADDDCLELNRHWVMTYNFKTRLFMQLSYW